MQKMLAVAFLATVAMVSFNQTSEANGGLFRRSKGCGDCGAAPCASAPCAGTVVAAAPAPVKYEERKVKVYKQVQVEKEIEVLVSKCVTKEEKYNYTVCVPVTKDEKRKVIECTPVTKQVDFTYTVMVPKTVQKKVQCTTYQCVREMVTEQVPVCKVVCVTCVDECGRCHTRRERVTVMETVTRCVVKRVPVVTEQVVNVTVCEPETRKGTRTVCEIVRAEKEIMVKVCSFENQQREGTRLVSSVVTEKVKRKVMVCETVATEETIRVVVGGGDCGAPCATTSGGHGHRFGGLFRRGSCGGCN